MTDIHFFDNTRIEAFRRCPLKYAMAHKRHWQREHKAIALIFGACWHKGFETAFNLWKDFVPLGATTKPTIGDLIHTARKGFDHEWTQVEGLSLDLTMQDMDNYKAKIPTVAYEMYESWFEKYYNRLSQVEILGVEQPFVFQLVKELGVYAIGRLDLVVRDYDGIWIWEHKTTGLYSRDYGIQSKFADGFSPNSQVDTYSYALHMRYPDKAKGVLINGSLTHKKIHDVHEFIPIYRSVDDLRTWHADTAYWTSQILIHEEQDYWPHNWAGCQTQYGACPYRDLCAMSYSPLDRKEPPSGFVERKWEPFSEEELRELMKEAE